MQMIAVSRFWSRTLTGLMTTSLLMVSSLVAVAATPLELIPANASVIIRLKNPEATIGKVGNFANQAYPGAGFLIQGNAAALGIAISNPTLGGVDLKQDWYVAAFAQKAAEPVVAFIVPATNVDQLKQSVGSTFTFAAKDKWVAYSTDEAAVELIEDCIEDSGKAVAGKIEARSGALFDQSDLSVYVNAAELATIYQEELAGADQQVDAFIELFGAQLATAQPSGINLESVFDLYGKLAKGVIQAVRDSEAFTLGVSVTNDGLAIEELLVVKTDTQTDKWLASQMPSELKLMNSLPQDSLGYFGLHGNFDGLISMGMEMLVGMVGEKEGMKEKIEAARDEMKTIKFGAMAGSFDLTEGDSGVLRVVSLMEAKPAQKLRDVGRKFQDLGQLELPGLKQSTEVKPESETYGDLKADVITIKQEFDEEADPLGMQKKMQSLMYGDEGMVQRQVIKGDLIIQTLGGGQDSMKAALEGLDRSATGESAMSKARGRLIEKANLVGLIDLPKLVSRGIQLAASSGQLPLPLPADKLAGLKTDPGYIGFASGTEKNALRLKTDISLSSIQGVVKVVNFLQQAAAAGNNNDN